MNNNRYDIGIVGFWYGINYGSVLTYYALYKALEERGQKPLLLSKPLNLWNDKYYAKDSLANKFFKDRCKTSRIRKDDADWRDVNNFCDKFIVGSDIVWKYTLPPKIGYYFFLDFAYDSKVKIAYASSFGGEWEGEPVHTAGAKFFLNRFDKVSCREIEGCNVAKNVFGVEAQQVVDPVFLIDRSYYDELADSVTIDRPAHYIAAYILGPGSAKRKLLLSLNDMMAAKKGSCELVNMVNAGNEEKGVSLLGLETQTNLTVEEWLANIKNSDLYIGDSFHGICFSIIFRKNFILIRNRVSPSRCRFDTLLALCGLESRSIYADEDISLRPDLLEDIDYDKVYERLTPIVENSGKWLDEALKTEKTPEASMFDFLMDKIVMLERKNTELTEKLDSLTNGENQ